MHTDQFVGRQIDAFTVEERIGQGGMASVYRAHQPSVNRSIALKIITLDPTLGERDEFRSRFAQEAKMIASLEHIHILPVYDYGIVNNEVAYIAMRLLRGGSLGDLLANGALDLERTADIFTQIARGLAYAHSKGVIHRDLKPSNILMDESGNAYLTDFGLAKMIESPMHLTKTGNIVGTPIYMSPEQLRGDDIDHRSDIYSMGGILYHMLVGHPPFEASDTNMVSVIYQHLEKEPIPPRQFNPAIPPLVEMVALRGLQKDPDNRYSAATEMADELNEALRRKLSTSSYPIVRVESRPTGILAVPAIPPTARRRRRVLAGLGIAAVLVVLAIAVLLVRTPPVSTAPTATVLEGEEGAAADAVPTDGEMDAALVRLGENGFVAYIACNQTSQYHAAQARELVEFAARVGMSVRVYDANNDKYLQLTLLERARTEGATALIVCPLDVTLLSDTLASAQRANVPMVFMASNMENYGGVLLAGDEYLMGLEAGRAAGHIIREELDGRANIILLDYPDMPSIVTRANGLADGVKEIAPAVRILGRYLGGTRENATQSVNDLFTAGVSFDAILSINDAGAYGAIDALEAHGIDPASVIITSIDAETLAREYILDNHFIRASVDVGREEFSRTAINVMVKLLAGSTVLETYLVPPGSVVTEDTLRPTPQP